MNKITVLLADEHSLYREGTRSIIEQEPDMVVTGEAVDGPEAVRLAADLRPDVVLMDTAIPNLNGVEATRQIKAASPSTAVLILTADDNDRYMLSLLEAGAAGYLLKSVSGGNLVNAIRAVLSGESVLHPDIARKIVSRLGKGSRQSGDRAPETELSEREMEILKLAAGSMSNQDIAARLCLSHRTVQAHLANIFRKMDVDSRTEAVLKAMRKGWLGLEDLP